MACSFCYYASPRADPKSPTFIADTIRRLICGHRPHGFRRNDSAPFLNNIVFTSTAVEHISDFIRLYVLDPLRTLLSSGKSVESSFEQILKGDYEKHPIAENIDEAVRNRDRVFTSSGYFDECSSSRCRVYCAKGVDIIASEIIVGCAEASVKWTSNVVDHKVVTYFLLEDTDFRNMAIARDTHIHHQLREIIRAAHDELCPTRENCPHVNRYLEFMRRRLQLQ